LVKITPENPNLTGLLNKFIDEARRVFENLPVPKKRHAVLPDEPYVCLQLL
jgi:hypothetical protein